MEMTLWATDGWKTPVSGQLYKSSRRREATEMESLSPCKCSVALLCSPCVSFALKSLDRNMEENNRTGNYEEIPNRNRAI